jgi:predicted homoserine dehydrogenase-like protein
MVWHENAGNEGTDVSVGLYGIGRFGEKIYSTIRRMVVVAVKHGHCICV